MYFKKVFKFFLISDLQEVINFSRINKYQKISPKWKTINTHIHNLNPEDSNTHEALNADDSFPLKEYINALIKVDYKGIYCLELMPERFSGKEEKKIENLMKSVHILKNQM